MSDVLEDRRDVDHLLRLIGMLGSPNRPGFWDSWRTNLDGYSFQKMQTYIRLCSEDEVSRMFASSFGSYVLKFFSESTAEGEARLVEEVGEYISAHRENQPAIQFLIDLRATAWRLMRDNSEVDPAVVAAEWAKADSGP
ncbi:hypothetical protein ACFXPZ_13930 [Streptomyces sp. NPDC059101]|uniref:hypothetical protein n=1 Tax=Streptomyces sp. NPDC059101 TaxID=3346728 RepID=UPI00367E73EE